MDNESDSTSSQTVPVPPDSVRVYRGFQLEGLDQQDFFKNLGSVFIPATVQIQAPVGLTAYMPSVMPAEKPPNTPDEIALVFYEVQQDYADAKLTVGGREYSLLHNTTFDLQKSLSGFPEPFTGTFEKDGKYYLFEDHIDWQHGYVTAFVGVPAGQETQAYFDGIAAFLKEVQAQGDEGPDGAVASGNADYIVYWEHWQDEASAQKSLVPKLAEMVETVYRQAIPAYTLNEGLWEKYEGVEVDPAGGSTFNFQFQRRAESS